MNGRVVLGSNRRIPFIPLLPYLVMAWCIGWMVYGFITYPYAPIKPCRNDLFCDKRHNEYTQVEYEQFRYWEMVLFMSWPFGIASGYVIRKRRRQAASIEARE